MSISIRKLLLGVGLVGCAVAYSYGDGLRNPPSGATAVGRIGGKVAQIDDPSAITHNPANITDLKEAEFMASLTLGYATKDFKTPMGTADSEDPWAALPSVFATWPLEKDGVVFGMGIDSPFGRSATFGKTSIIRYSAAYYSRLRSLNFNPTVATKFGDNLSVGVGFDVLWSDLKLDQYYPWSAVTGNPADQDGVARFDADGVGYGGNIGVTWDITKKQRLAATYRSSISVDYDGDFDISSVPNSATLPPPVNMASQHSDFSTTIEFPAVLALGYGVQATDKLQLEADVEWVQHSVFQSLDLGVQNNQVLFPSSKIPVDYDDTWTFGLGGEYKLNETWVARAGYMYLPTPAPTSTMLPSTAEADQSVISVGLGYEKNGHRIDLAYALGIIDDRNVDDNPNPALNGDYEFDSQLFTLSYGHAL